MYTNYENLNIKLNVTFLIYRLRKYKWMKDIDNKPAPIFLPIEDYTTCSSYCMSKYSISGDLHLYCSNEITNFKYFYIPTCCSRSINIHKTCLFIKRLDTSEKCHERKCYNSHLWKVLLPGNSPMLRMSPRRFIRFMPVYLLENSLLIFV